MHTYTHGKSRRIWLPLGDRLARRRKLTFDFVYFCIAWIYFNKHVLLFSTCNNIFLRIVQRLRKANFTATVQKMAVISKKSSPGWGMPELHLARTFRTQMHKIDSCFCVSSAGEQGSMNPRGNVESSRPSLLLTDEIVLKIWSSGRGTDIFLYILWLPFWWTCNLHKIHTSLFIIHHFHVRSVIFCILLPHPN